VVSREKSKIGKCGGVPAAESKKADPSESKIGSIPKRRCKRENGLASVTSLRSHKRERRRGKPIVGGDKRERLGRGGHEPCRRCGRQAAQNKEKEKSLIEKTNPSELERGGKGGQSVPK